MSRFGLTDAAGNPRIPDLQDLLRTPPEIRNRDAANCAADNALHAIVPGVRAIGDLLWQAAERGDGELSSKTLAGIGGLLMHLADFQMEVEGIRDCTRASDPATWLRPPAQV